MLILVQQTGSGEVQLVEIPTPTVAPGFVLVRNHASAVSVGTEKMAIEFGKKSIVAKAMERPQQVRQVLASIARDGLSTTARRVRAKLDSYFAPGYSSAGTVIAIGEGVSDVKVGDRVACAGAGYAVHAEHVLVPKNLVTNIPEGVAFEAAAFTTLGAIALQGIRQAEPRLGESVVVIGLGLLGQLTVQMLLASGVQAIAVDLDPARVELAREGGALAILRGEDVEGLIDDATGGIGADSVIIAAATSSDDPIQLAGLLARERGKVVIVGAVPINVPRSPYYEKELDVRLSRSYGPGRYDSTYEEKGQDYPIGYVRWTEGRNMEAFLDLLANERLNIQPLVTHRLDFRDAEVAYARIMDPESGRSPLGVVFDYGTNEVEPASRIPMAASRVLAGDALGVSLVGPGSFARETLVPSLAALGVTFRGVASSGGVSARNLAESNGFAFLASSLNEILTDEATDAVVIATPHADHSPQSAAALDAGKAVFVEKPLALNFDQLRSVLSVAKSGPQLMVGFNRRFAPATLLLREALDRTPGGRIIHVRVSAGRIPKSHWIHDPDIGGGRLLGEGCHFIDLAVFLAGSPPVEVSCVGLRKDAEASLEDNFVATLRFADGSIASVVYTSRGDRSLGKERVEVFAGDTTGIIDDFCSAEVWRGGSVKRWKGKQDKGHKAEMSAFVQAVRTGGASPIPLPDLEGTSLTTLLALQSLRDGTVRAVEWPADQPRGGAAASSEGSVTPSRSQGAR